MTDACSTATASTSAISPTATRRLDEALQAHTDLVAGSRASTAPRRVLDVGCGLGAPALRMARRYGCNVTGVNISREQVRQGNELIAEQGLSDRVEHRARRRAGARLPGRIVRRDRLPRSGRRHLRHRGGQARASSPSSSDSCGRAGASGSRTSRSAPGSPTDDDRELRAVLYHSAAELVTDWPAVFARQGFVIASTRT